MDSPEFILPGIKSNVAMRDLNEDLRTAIGELVHLRFDTVRVTREGRRIIEAEKDLTVAPEVECYTDNIMEPPFLTYVVPVLDGQTNAEVGKIFISEDGAEMLPPEKNEAALVNVRMLDPNRPPPGRDIE